MDIRLVSKELKEALQPLYGKRFSKLVLFGSFARSDFREESDIDYMLVLKDKEVNPFQAIAEANEILSGFLLKYGRVFSVAATSEEKFSTYNSAFYHFVRKDGIEIQ